MGMKVERFGIVEAFAQEMGMIVDDERRWYQAEVRWSVSGLEQKFPR